MTSCGLDLFNHLDFCVAIAALHLNDEKMDLMLFMLLGFHMYKQTTNEYTLKMVRVKSSFCVCVLGLVLYN